MLLIFPPLSKTRAWAEIFPLDDFGSGSTPLLALLGKRSVLIDLPGSTPGIVEEVETSATEPKT